MADHKNNLPATASRLVKGNTREQLKNLDGLFFIYIYDKMNCRHYLINNNYQLTKLFYHSNGEQLRFSDRLETLMTHLDSIEPHFPSFINFFNNGFNQSDQTQVKGVKRLLPSFWLEVDTDGVRLKQRWRDYYHAERKAFTDLETQLDVYEDTYRSGLQHYLNQRQPQELGTLLSGGHDTSFALIQASKVHPKPIHCFTTVFSGWGFSEHTLAENICRKFGGTFHPVEFNEKGLDALPDLIYATEEPALGSSLPLHILGRAAAQYTDTLLGGDGGDTLWGEYYPVGEYHRWVKDLPLSSRKALAWLADRLKSGLGWERFWELEHVARLFASHDPYDNFMSRLCTYRHFSNQQLHQMLTPELRETSPQKSELMIEFTKDNFDESLIEGKLFNAFFTYQSCHQTRSMNSHGLEFFLPTVQKDIVKFITSLPMEWINGGTALHRLTNNKRINRRFHKRALSRYLDRQEIYNRSFDIPWHRILTGQSSVLLNLETALNKRGWYNSSYVAQLFSEYKTHRPKDHEILELRSHGYRIMTLMSAEVWCRTFLDRKVCTDDEVSLSEYLAD
jgi:asparagine synthase (glutamine-hydrolysing)